MGMTDPVADMLTRIRNAARARHESVEMPASHVKEAIAKLLVEEGYLQDVKRVKIKQQAGEVLRMQIKFDQQNNPIILGLKRISRPGRRVYVGTREILLIRKGLGVNILSTSRGIMVDRKALRAHLGGELMCAVW